MYMQSKDVKIFREGVRTLTACIIALAMIFSGISIDAFAGNAVDLGFNLDFSIDSSDRETTGTGISWKRDTVTDTYILTLNNIDLSGNRDITLPTDKKVIIKLIGNNNMYNGQLITNGAYAFKITITGGGTLNTKALPSGGADGDTLTIEGGAKVYVKSVYLMAAQEELTVF